MTTYATVEALIDVLDDKRKSEVNALRRIIQNSHPDITERIKWNSSSFVLNGEDRLTFNMHYPEKTLLILHMGASKKENKKGEPIMQDDSGLIAWKSDIRGILAFTSLNDINASKPQLERIISRWLLLL